MSFWARFYNLCVERDIKPNPLAKQIGVSSGAVTKWKNGTIPPAEVLIKISDYFNVSVDYLLGKTDIKRAAAHNERPKNDYVDIILEKLNALDDDKASKALDYLNYLISQQENQDKQ